MSEFAQTQTQTAETATPETVNVPAKILPKTKGEMLAARLSEKASSFNDVVEGFMLDHWEDEELQRFLETNDADDSVTGRTDYDDLMAAKRLQELADIEGIVPIVAAKLTVVKKAMAVVLRRYGATRKQRQEAAIREAEARAGARDYGTVVS